MPTINGRACVVNGTPVDKVFSDGRQVYGRNLLMGTSTPIQRTGNGTANNIASAYTFGGKQLKDIVEAGMNVTLSFDWQVPIKGESGTFLPQLDLSPWRLGFSSVNISGGSGHFSKSVYLSDDMVASTANGIQLRLDNVTTTITISNMKLENGTTATPWTPAPEDVM